MTRRTVDWILIAVLVGSWAVFFARGIEDGLRTGRGQICLGVSSAAGSDAYPVVLWTCKHAAIAIGDAVLSVAGHDLRGASALRFFDVATKSARETGHAFVTVLRDGDRLEADAGPLTPSRFWWTRFVSSAGRLAFGVLLLLAAPTWHLGRRSLLSFWCFAVANVVHEMISGSSTAFEAVAYAVSNAAGTALLIWSLQDFSPSAPPVPRWQRALPLTTAALALTSYLVFHHLPRTTRPGDVLLFVQISWGVTAVLIALTRTYVLSDGHDRRQLRWIVLGFYVGLLGVLATIVPGLPAIFPGLYKLASGHAEEIGRVGGSFFALALPAGMIGAVVGSRWLDVDRLISAAASWTIVGVVALGGALAVVPAVASAAAPVLGLSPAVAQWLLALAVVLAALPAHRALWPRLDHQLFAERHRRMTRLELLVDELDECPNAAELWKRVTSRLDALLEPESLVVYARDGEVFAPRVARGVTAAQDYDADSLLVRALERRGRPLATDSAELDPFDRAALETLRVALVVPVRTGEGVLAFVCLGRKRSGDVYTPEERAHLAALGARCGDLLRPAATAPAAQGSTFRREGDLWTLASNGKEVRLRDMRGLHYLATLLREPGREFSPLDLVRAATGVTVAGAAADPELRVARRIGDAGPVLDAQARTEYRARVTALEAELADAERCADLGRIERANAEREALLAELESSARGRTASSDAERARVAVTKAIKFALERVADAHPELGAHLAATVRRGYACAYVPDPRATPDWEL